MDLCLWQVMNRLEGYSVPLSLYGDTRLGLGTPRSGKALKCQVFPSKAKEAYSDSEDEEGGPEGQAETPMHEAGQGQDHEGGEFLPSGDGSFVYDQSYGEQSYGGGTVQALPIEPHSEAYGGDDRATVLATGHEGHEESSYEEAPYEEAGGEVTGYHDEAGNWVEGYYDAAGSWVVTSENSGWGGAAPEYEYGAYGEEDAVGHEEHAGGEGGFYDEYGNWVDQANQGEGDYKEQVHDAHDY